MSSTRDNKKGRAKQSTVNELKLLQRRQKVASLYLEGIPQHVIQEMLHIGYTTVIRDLKAIRVYWLSVMAADFNEAKSTELAKIDHLEATAWKAWKRSTRPAHTRHTSVERGIKTYPKKDRDGNVIKGAVIAKMVPVKELDEQTEKGQVGDPRFLEIVDRCSERRLKLMGMLAEKAANNIYLDFSTLLKEKQQELANQPDVIENEIQQLAHKETVNEEHKEGSNGEHKEETNGSTQM